MQHKRLTDRHQWDPQEIPKKLILTELLGRGSYATVLKAKNLCHVEADTKTTKVSFTRCNDWLSQGMKYI